MNEVPKAINSNPPGSYNFTAEALKVSLYDQNINFRSQIDPFGNRSDGPGQAGPIRRPPPLPWTGLRNFITMGSSGRDNGAVLSAYFLRWYSGVRPSPRWLYRDVFAGLIEYRLILRPALAGRTQRIRRSSLLEVWKLAG